MSNRDSKSELQIFLTGLDTACEQIPKDYFYFPVYSEKGTIYRERVYCYELYHQLRLALRRGFKYVLSGEVDKRMHPVLNLIREGLIDVHQKQTSFSCFHTFNLDHSVNFGYNRISRSGL